MFIQLPRTLSLMFVVIFIFSSCANKKEKKVKDIVENVSVVKVEIAKFSSIEDVISSTGMIEAETLIKISSKIGGKVESVSCTEGNFVKKGQILLKLETKEILYQKDQTLAMKKQSQINLENIRKNYERMKSLYQEGVVSQQGLEQIETSKEVVEAQLEAAEAGLSLIEMQLENCFIKAPISGKISMKLVEVSEVIGPGIPLFQIIDISSVKIKIGISEEKIKEVKVGKKVRILSSVYPDKKFEGYINFVSPSASPLTRLFEVELKIPNNDELLKPGMLVQVEIITKKVDNVLVLSESAVLDEEGKKVVFVYQEGIAQKREITTGIESKGNIEIKGGMKENELVIIEGSYGLQDGTKVEKEN